MGLYECVCSCKRNSSMSSARLVSGGDEIGVVKSFDDSCQVSRRGCYRTGRRRMREETP